VEWMGGALVNHAGEVYRGRSGMEQCSGNMESREVVEQSRKSHGAHK
jgi:hypothetical protein